jgi:hypothetical protein
MKSLNCPLHGEQDGVIDFTRVLAGGGTTLATDLNRGVKLKIVQPTSHRIRGGTRR